MHDEYVAALEAENDVLRERIAELEREFGLASEEEVVPLIFGLTESESKIVSLLVKRGSATKEQLLTVVTRDVTGNLPPDIKIVDVYVCKIRKKLQPFGIKIETMWGRGYAMTPESRQSVTRYLNSAAPALHPVAELSPA